MAGAKAMVIPLPYHSPGSFVRYLFTLTGVKSTKNSLFYSNPLSVGEGLHKVLNNFQVHSRGEGNYAIIRHMYCCINCRSEFVGQKYNANKYCSRECMILYRWPPSQRKFKKIDGVWYKGSCARCHKPITSQYAKKCHDCAWEDKRNPTVIAGKPVPHYHSAHWWIKKNYGRANECESCGFTSKNGRQFNWANLSGKYLKERSDWKRLCVKCHIFMDRRGGLV